MPDISLQLKEKPYPRWEMTTILPSWNGFQSRRGPYGSRDQSDASDGTVAIQLVREGTHRPTEAEITAVSWVIEHEELISHSAIESLFSEYRSLQELYGYSGEKKIELMPDIESVDDLRSLIGLHTVYVHQPTRGGIPYAGLELGCSWESEHGLGILMRGSQTTEIGWADTAFLPVRKDAGDAASGSLIVAPRRIPGWPPASRKDGWVKTSGVPLCASTEDEFFRRAGAQFSIVGPLVSEVQIRAIFPEAFSGADELVRFYLRFNGGSRSPESCVMHCGNPAHRVQRTELARLSLEGFRSIPLNADDRMPPFANMLRHHMTLKRIYSQVAEMKSFLDEHMGIAFDHSGRDLCISRQSGRIFFMDWTAYKEGPVEVASSFRELVQRFWNSHQGTIHS